MAATAVGDIYQVTVKGSIHGQITLTTFKYELFEVLEPNPTTDTVALDVFTEWHKEDGIAFFIKSSCPSTWTYQETWCQRIANQRTVKNTSIVASGPGTRPAATTTNVSSCITRRGEAATRSAVGGIRLPLSPADVLNGELIGAVKIPLQELAIAMRFNITSTDVKLRPVLFTPAKLSPPVPASFHPILFTSVQTTARVMRRRTVGLGK